MLYKGHIGSINNQRHKMAPLKKAAVQHFLRLSLPETSVTDDKGDHGYCSDPPTNYRHQQKPYIFLSLAILSLERAWAAAVQPYTAFTVEILTFGTVHAWRSTTILDGNDNSAVSGDVLIIFHGTRIGAFIDDLETMHNQCSFRLHYMST